LSSALTSYLLLLSVGLAGFVTFKKLSLPVPALLGPLFFAGALNLAGHYPDVSMLWVSRCCNIAIGAIAGARVNRESAQLLRRLPLPALTVSLSMLLLSLAGGALLCATTDLSPRTAFIGATTGGIAEMAMLSISLGADSATVTLLQVTRLLTALIAAPAICRALTKRLGRRTEAPAHIAERRSEANASWANYAILAAASIAGGAAGLALRMPVGALTGAMIGAAAANLLNEELPPVPVKIRIAAQIGIGVTIASNVSHSTFANLSSLLLPVLLILCLMLLCSVAIAELLHRMTGWDYPTCLLSASLGGLSQMVVVAEEMGADPLKVTALQTIRLLSILIVLPFVFSLVF